jgi:DNA-binding MarR family transcriptional regulator
MSTKQSRTRRGKAGPADDAPRLDDQLCFMFYATSRAIVDAYRPALASIGLTYPQYLVMLILWEQDGQAVGEIGAKLRLESNTLTPLLKRLEANGLVMRERDRRDERQVRIALTSAGRRLKRAVHVVPEALACRLTLPAATVEQLRLHMDLILRTLGTGVASSEQS